MLLEYNKFTSLVYFITGTTITFAGRRWIYGSLIILLSAVIMIQRAMLMNVSLIRYSNITDIIALSIFIGFILISLFVLKKSMIELNHKLFSLFFLSLSIMYSIIKYIYRSEPSFNTQISKYISTLLFMVFLWSMGMISDNQAILKSKFDEYRDKIKRF